MKMNSKFVTVGLAAFIIGLSVNNFAISDVPANFKVAVVDVQKVVSGSGQVNSLKEEQRKKIDELSTFVEKAKNDLNKESDANKKKALEEKYNKELNVKKDKIEKEYAAKLSEIDKSISGTISAKAKEGKFDLVLAKGVVLFGGEDITANVAKAVK